MIVCPCNIQSTVPIGGNHALLYSAKNMNVTSEQTQKLNNLLAALAILGESDQVSLECVLAHAVDDQLLAHLTAHPEITHQESKWVISPAFAVSIVNALESEDFLHFRILHHRAVTHLAKKLRNGEAEVEATLMVAFTRLADHLRVHDAARLPELLAAVGELPLLIPQNQHFFTYIQGIGLQQTGLYAELLALCDGLLEEPDLETRLRGRAHNLRATGHYFLGRLQQARDDYRASVKIMLEIGNNLGAGIALQNMGALAYDLQDYDEAETLLHQAANLFVLENSAAWLAAAQNELGLVYRDQGKWTEATRAFERFIEQSRASAADDDIAIGLLNLGEVQFFQGELTAAEATFQHALGMMTTDAFRIDLLLNLGMIRQLHSDLQDAERYFQEAYALTTRLGRRLMLAAVHYRLACLYREMNDIERAFHHLVLGIDVVEETRTPLREEGLKISLLGRWQQLFEEIVLLLVEQHRYTEAFAYVERARSRAFLDLLAAGASAAATGSEEPMAPTEIQAHLPPGAAIIEFFATGLPGTLGTMLDGIPDSAHRLKRYLLPPTRLLAFVVSNHVLQAVELNASIQQIELQNFHPTDGRLRGTQPVPGQPLRPNHRWRDLARRLLLPLQSHLTGFQHLFYVPHGLLHYVPLHACVDVQQLTGVSNCTVSYSPSASILFMRRPLLSHAKRGSLAIGVNGRDLHHAEAEAAWLAARLGGDRLLGAEAQRTRVIQALPHYAVIHFSCHGHFRQRDPLASALALYDHDLTAGELLQMTRLSADLVTLSACDTGLNQLHPGDELMGLTRAFLGNGVHSLLVTLWAIHEIPTRIFVEQFYGVMMEGTPKAAALATAQQHLRQMDMHALQHKLEEYGLSELMIAETTALFRRMLPGQNPFDHPYYWGAFLLLGDPF